MFGLKPLEWWKEWKLAYPYLSKLVRKLYSMVATSVPSESTAGKCDSREKKLFTTR